MSKDEFIKECQKGAIYEVVKISDNGNLIVKKIGNNEADSKEIEVTE